MATVDKSYILALGPLKLEVADVSSYTNGDTITSRLVRPLFAGIFPQADLAGTAAGSASVSGKTITLNDANPNADGTDDIVVLIFGF